MKRKAPALKRRLRTTNLIDNARWKMRCLTGRMTRRTNRPLSPSWRPRQATGGSLANETSVC